MFLAVIFIVLYLIWVFGGFYVATEAGGAYRPHHNVLLAILIGILGFLVFHGFRALG